MLALVKTLNRDDRVDGILLQLPLPKGLDSTEIMDTIDPAKDVDGFHPTNTGLLAQKRPGLRPCTPWGVIRLAKEYRLDLDRPACRGRRRVEHRGPSDGARAVAGALDGDRVPHGHA